MELAIFIISAVALAVAGYLFYRSTRQNAGGHPIMLLQQQLDAIREQLRASLDGNSQVVTNQLSELAKQLQGQLHNQIGTLASTRKAMDERLDNAARVIGEMQKSMGQVREALTPISEIRDILKAPKLRGGFGEVMLEKLLEEMMPAKFYIPQYQFANGERVDAAINFGGQLVPIDSKFPLDKYQEYLQAASEDDKKSARKGLISAVKKHIADVSKYIRPDEGTYPFALMYIPSENIYYELFVSNAAEESLWPHASSNRVFPVSSNTLYLYLQTISFGLRGMKIAEDVQELFGKLEQLQKNFGDIRGNYEKVGTHLKNAQKAYDNTEKSLNKFEDKFTALGTESKPALSEPSPEEKKEEEPALIQ